MTSPNQFGEYEIPKPTRRSPNQNGDCLVTNQNRFGDLSKFGKCAKVPKSERHSNWGSLTDLGIPELVWAGKLRRSKSGSTRIGSVVLPNWGLTHTPY